jgi:hypothetical protein
MRVIMPLITDARGSLGGTVFSRNPFGRYTRARTPPIQPRTPLQVAHRVTFATAAAHWRSLSRASIDEWKAYAATLVHTDSLGQRSNPSGFTTFVSRWIQSTLVGGTIPPYIPNAGLFIRAVPFSITAATIVSGTLLNLTVTQVGGFPGAQPNLVYAATPGQGIGINFVPRTSYRTLGAGGFYLAGSINIAALYNAVLPTPPIGSVIRVRLRYTDASGLAGPFTYASATVS